MPDFLPTKLTHLASLFAVILTTAAFAQDSPSLKSVVDAPEETILDEAGELEPVDELLESLTVAEKIGQLMLVTFETGHRPSTEEKRLLVGATPGGVFLPNITSPKDFEDYVADLRANRVEVDKSVPILIATDYFSLTANRHTEYPYAPVPSPLAIAACADEQLAEETATLIADYMEGFGISIHFGPSLGLSSNIEGVAASLKHFGERADIASDIARTFAGVFSDRGVSWMPRNFPGGDANRVNGGPAVLVTPREMLAERDLAPFVETFAGDARFMHVGNVVTPTLDRQRVPASISYQVMTKLLREDLGFDGVIVAGPFDSPDFKRAYSGENAPERALLAGADMLLWDRPTPNPERWIAKLAQRVEAGALPESLIDEKVRRILQAKHDLELATQPLPKYRTLRRLTDAQDKQARDRKLEQAGIVMVKLTRGMLPLDSENSAPLGIAGVAGVHELHDILEKEVEPTAEFYINSAKHGNQIFDFEMDRMLRYAKGTRTVICLFNDQVRGATQRQLLKRIKEVGARTITVMFGLPADLEKYLHDSDVLIVVLADESFRVDVAMGAIAQTLLGEGSLRVLAPTRDLAVAANESIDFDLDGLVVTPASRLPVSVGEEFPAGHATGFAPSMDKRKVLWNFGDGAQQSGTNVTHRYAEPGRYVLNVTIEGKGEELARGEFGIVVGGGN